MSWQTAVFAGLILILACGFAWYERGRPPARLVALVAALAALAVAGRLVLAPIPNLVATTDVVLLTGYALGGAPGFAVGALAAPISNIWLGQGPWTPWQMAGWGLVGVGGSALAGLVGRRLGRWPLAIACALAALAYGALLDLSTMVTYGGEQSLDRYLALSARGIPFNVVHAVGSLAIALAAGPALVRMISRYRARLEFTWRSAGAASVMVVAAGIGSWAGSAVTEAAPADGAPPMAVRGRGVADPGRVSPAGAVSSQRLTCYARITCSTRQPRRLQPAPSASWLARTQNRDGGFGATAGYPSSPAMTGWAMLGLEASGRNPLDVRRGGATAVSYLRSERRRLRSVGDLERTILALEGAGLDARDFAGRDLVAPLRARRGGDGSLGGQVNLTAFYALALRAAGVDRAHLGRSARWLQTAQNRDGGWGIHPRAPSDAESTGAALQGLAATGAARRASVAGVRFLRRAQRPGGGYTVGTTGVVNSQATAWAVQGMLAAGGGGKPLRRALSYLESLRAPDGHYRYSRSSDQTPVWVTAQALLAVARRPFPLAAVPRRKAPPRGSPGRPAGATVPDAGATAPDPAPVAGAGGEAAGRAANAGAGPAAARSSSSAVARGEERNTGSAAAGARSAGSGSERETAATAEAEAEARSGAPGSGAAVEAAPTSSTSDGGPATGPWVWAGLGALAVALAGGFLWYRRHLP